MGLWKRLFSADVSGGINPIHNGENRVLGETVKLWLKDNKEKFVLFDVGGNIGGYSEGAIDVFEAFGINYEIHVFEPQVSCFEKLKDKFKNNQNVILNNYGLGRIRENISLHKTAEGSSGASIFKRNVYGEEVFTEKILLENGDAYIENKVIDRINFLKIDTEGNELNVLSGFRNALNLKIENIQFEYGGTYEDAAITLKEMFQLLESSFRVGKILPKNVAFTKFSDSLEDYRYSNYFATRKHAD
jgi:FkbM family methyltransferase